MLYSLDIFFFKNKTILFVTHDGAAGLVISLSTSVYLLPSEMFVSTDAGSSMRASCL